MFLDDVREVLDTSSDNVAYTTAEGALLAFRRRLTPRQVLTFADALPSLLRALFLQGWRMEDPVPWSDRDAYDKDVKALRKHHNFATDRGLEAVSFALHRAMGKEKLDKQLARIGPEAAAFWALDGYGDEELRFRFR